MENKNPNKPSGYKILLNIFLNLISIDFILHTKLNVFFIYLVFASSFITNTLFFFTYGDFKKEKEKEKYINVVIRQSTNITSTLSAALIFAMYLRFIK